MNNMITLDLSESEAENLLFLLRHANTKGYECGYILKIIETLEDSLSPFHGI